MAKILTAAPLGALTLSLGLATPAMAQSVVGEIFDLMTESGGNLSFEMSEDGNTTTWNNVVATDPDGEMTLTINWIKEVAVGDKYTITLAPNVLMQGDVDGDTLTMSLSNEDLVYTVNRSGDGLAMTYEAVSVGFALSSAPSPVAFNLVLDNLSGADTFGAGWKDGAGEMSAGAISFRLAVSEDGTDVKAESVSNDLTLSYAYGGFPENLEEVESPDEILDALVQFAITTSGNNGSGSFGENGQNISFTVTGGASDTSFDMSNGEVSYHGAAEAIAYSVNPTEMGLPPVDVNLAEVAFSMAMPIAKKDEVSPVEYVIKMLGLEVSEGLWRMVDPGQTIPRDPANLIIDLAGNAKWVVSLGELAMSGEPDQMPVQFDDVEVRDITVQIGGAEVLASGSGKMMNLGPMPLPIGRLDIAINGVNGLIDKLAALGLLTPDMILPVRAVMGAYTTPVGEDQLTSSIEMTEDGRLLANGLPLQ